jgi:4-amino-4-deoxychorismate lyase
MTDWFQNGDATGQVDANDRGFQYGDGLFETVAIRNDAPRLWQYHMDRLSNGCKLLGIEKPADTALYEGVMHALRHSDVPTAYSVVKIIVSAGTGRRGYGRPTATAPTVLFGAFPAAPPPVKLFVDGVDLVLCRTRLASNSPTAGLKTLNRLEQVLARSEFIATGEFEGLTMDADDNIICGTMSNVFFVTNNSISTPALDRCGVAGVMRRHVIETLRVQGIDTHIQAVNLAHLKNIDEVFVSNSQFGVMPVRSCGTMQWPVGVTTKHVMSILADNDVAECRQ